MCRYEGIRQRDESQLGAYGTANEPKRAVNSNNAPTPENGN